MSQNSQLSAVIALLIIGFIIVVAILAVVFALTCARSSTEYSFQHRTSGTIPTNYSRTRNRRRHLIRFGGDSPLFALNPFGRRDLPGSDSFPESLSISPSQPSIFGDSKDSEDLVKIVLTPPTPARRERRASLVNPDDEDT
ncbi:hypothetical protein M413DRAFT_107282 [Hebeloma cylindrosporum]|uniref:Uncharacterized protein n=1 Tax=Hebeloma cylindrosporum TaxID=76867 RepID=A0A0C3CL32_HEBCY|nr:hypothetical protein M413DRAFT_107282 [Hebeloma cylindrosporum h7]